MSVFVGMVLRLPSGKRWRVTKHTVAGPVSAKFLHFDDEIRQIASERGVDLPKVARFDIVHAVSERPKLGGWYKSEHRWSRQCWDELAATGVVENSDEKGQRNG